MQKALGSLMDDNQEGFELPLDGVLDLHTFQPADCKTLVPEYLRACRERNILEIRIVHGKGRGVLRAIVQSVLAAEPCVIDYCQAPPDAGGWGATLVRIAPPAPERHAGG